MLENQVEQTVYIKVRVRVEERQTKEGKKFNVYKSVDNKGVFTDLRFTKACSESGPLPKDDCYILVKEENINLDNRRLYPCFWVKEIEKILPLENTRKVDSSLRERFDTLVDDPNVPY